MYRYNIYLLHTVRNKYILNPVLLSLHNSFTLRAGERRELVIKSLFFILTGVTIRVPIATSPWFHPRPNALFSV